MRPDLNVITRELPVSYDGSSTALRAALQDVQPDALISLGVAVGRDVVSLEQVAINLDSAGIEDNDGDQRCDEPIAPGGQEAYFSSLPVRASFERLRAAGEPVEISYTAGTYVCNHVFYEGQRISRELGLSIPAGFVHVPATCADGEEATEGVELTATATPVAWCVTSRASRSCPNPPWCALSPRLPRTPCPRWTSNTVLS